MVYDGETMVYDGETIVNIQQGKNIGLQGQTITQSTKVIRNKS